MKKLWSRIKYYVFLAIGVLLLYVVFKDVDFRWMWNEIRGAHFGWVGLSVFCGILAMASRAWRWRLLLEPLGYKPGFLVCFYGVSIGYFANVGLPRIGEIVRCTVVNQRTDIPVTQLFGTVILERVIDVVMLLSLITAVTLYQIDLFGNFFLTEVFGDKIQRFNGFVQGKGLILIPVVIAILLIILWLSRIVWRKIRNTAVIKKVTEFFRGIGDGLVSLFKLKKKGAFIFHTLFIWTNYFLMTWVSVYAYDPTSMLKAMDGLFLMVVGGLGMSAPVQGGFGAFHYLIEKALFLYNIVPSENPRTGAQLRPGLVFATIVHSSQFIMTMVVGAVSLLFFTLGNKKKNGKSAARSLKE